jgi:AcrR family transcriptional regulator
VFLASGYGATSVAAIAKAAGVGHGSFYVYFAGKQEVFSELADRVMDQIYAATRAPAAITDPARRLEHENRRFFELYREHARMFTLIEEAVHADADFAQAWRAMRRRRVQRLVRAITRLQDRDDAVPSLDPGSLAEALGAMAERLAYLSTVDDGMDTEALLATLNALWQRALGVEIAAAGGQQR